MKSVVNLPLTLIRQDRVGFSDVTNNLQILTALTLQKSIFPSARPNHVAPTNSNDTRAGASFDEFHCLWHTHTYTQFYTISERSIELLGDPTFGTPVLQYIKTVRGQAMKCLECHTKDLGLLYDEPEFTSSVLQYWVSNTADCRAGSLCIQGMNNKD